MKVYCPEHKRGFFAPRQSPIKCENRGHILGELDFEGEANLPIEIHWQYCCNCEHFCPIDFNQGGLERCGVCNRRSSALYLCNRCLTVSFESNTPIQTKNFTITSEGAPQPSCPGCLHATSTDTREHTCDELGASFFTALDSCPICLERLDIGPSFPSSVAHYLRRTKAANKQIVTFDYESGLFAAVDDGEFVLVRNDEETRPIVLPRSARLATKRDFYEFYQDYYHCAKPGTGEMYIVQPADVAEVENGWRFQTPGVLEVLEDQPKKKAPTVVTRQQIDPPARDNAGLSTVEIKEELPVTPCSHCGSLVETKYAFCWTCGNPLKPENKHTDSRAEKPAILAPTPTATDEENFTAQHQVASVGSPIFSWALKKEPELLVSSKSAMLKLLAVVFAGSVFVTLGLFVLMGSASRTGSDIDGLSAAQTAQAVSGVSEGDKLAADPTPSRTSTTPEEDELKRIRAQRIAAKASERPAILKALAKTERRYPNDYRFPYERAKLAIKGKRSHKEAFAALSIAAEKAINTGKAQEMLNGLEADKRRDFQKLSNERQEWAQLEEALKSKDPNLLNQETQ